MVQRFCTKPHEQIQRKWDYGQKTWLWFVQEFWLLQEWRNCWSVDLFTGEFTWNAQIITGEWKDDWNKENFSKKNGKTKWMEGILKDQDPESYGRKLLERFKRFVKHSNNLFLICKLFTTKKDTVSKCCSVKILIVSNLYFGSFVICLTLVTLEFLVTFDENVLLLLTEIIF